MNKQLKSCLFSISTHGKTTVQVIRCAHKPFTAALSRPSHKHLFFTRAVFMPIPSFSLFPERAEFVHLEYGLTL